MLPYYTCSLAVAWLTAGTQTGRAHRNKVISECGCIATCNRWPDYCKIAFTSTGQQFDYYHHLYHSACWERNYPMWTADAGCEMTHCFFLFFLCLHFFRLTPCWQWKLKCAIVKQSLGSELKVVGESLGNPVGEVLPDHMRHSLGGMVPGFSKLPGKCSKFLRRKRTFFFFDRPVQSRRNHDNIKHSAPCWLHTARVPLSWFCRPARCPTYCQWANVGCHGISRKHARGAAALMMKCTQSQTHIDNKTQTGAEELWPCSTACVASISVQSRGVSAHRVLTQALFSRRARFILRTRGKHIRAGLWTPFL